MTTPTAHARDLEALLLAVVATPGDLATRFALADLACDLGNAEAVGQALLLPGHWKADWDCRKCLYEVRWQLDAIDEGGHNGVIVGFLRRKFAPRCARCKKYQPQAMPDTAWIWLCGECRFRVGRRLMRERSLASHYGAEAILKVNQLDFACCPRCQGTGIVGSSLCRYCNSTGEVPRRWVRPPS